MHAREHIIRDRFAGQACGHCGELYLPDGVIVLARRPSAWMVMASCRKCQNRCIYVVSFHDSRPGISIQPSNISHLLPGGFLPSTSPTSPTPSLPTAPLASQSDPLLPSSPPISFADVEAVHRFLHDFDGDFRGLFAQQRPGRTDDTTTG